MSGAANWRLEDTPQGIRFWIGNQGFTVHVADDPEEPEHLAFMRRMLAGALGKLELSGADPQTFIYSTPYGMGVRADLALALESAGFVLTKRAAAARGETSSATAEHAAWLLECYANYLHSDDVKAADLARHPYLPEIEEAVERLRAPSKDVVEVAKRKVAELRGQGMEDYAVAAVLRAADCSRYCFVGAQGDVRWHTPEDVKAAQDLQGEQPFAVLAPGMSGTVYFPSDPMYHYWVGRNGTPLFQRALAPDAGTIRLVRQLAEWFVQHSNREGMEAGTSSAYFTAGDKVHALANELERRAGLQLHSSCAANHGAAAAVGAPDGARVLTCVYCGHEYPQDTPAWGDQVLTEHIKGCEKHPMRAVIVERDQLQDDLRRLVDHAAEVCNAAEDGESDQANEAWRALPDHLVHAIEQRQAALRAEGGPVVGTSIDDSPRTVAVAQTDFDAVSAGQLPAWESPLMEVHQQGASFATRQLADLLEVKDWCSDGGTESYEGDLKASLGNLLSRAGTDAECVTLYMSLHVSQLRSMPAVLRPLWERGQALRAAASAPLAAAMRADRAQ